MPSRLGIVCFFSRNTNADHSSPTLQHIAVDCAEGTGNLGCSGGNMDTTFAWLIDNYRGGINTESSYPYTGIQGSCRASPSNNGAYIK